MLVRRTGYDQDPLSLNVGQAQRRLADVKVRAGRRASHPAAKRDKRDVLLTQILHQRPPFGTVGMERHVHGVSVVEMHLPVHLALAARADRQRMTEPRGEKLFDLSRVRRSEE